MHHRSVVLAAVVTSCLCIMSRSQAIPFCMETYEKNYESKTADGRWVGPSVPLYNRAEARVGIYRAGNANSEALQRVLAQQLSLPEVVLRRSTSNVGDAKRMRSLFQKLRNGKPISLVVLGGSISCGADTTRLDQEWTRRVFQFINNTWPHANHTFLNSCKPATPSMLIDACLDGYVPEKVDLVLMEFSVNDDSGPQGAALKYTGVPFMDNENRRGFERLLRKLLKLPSKPALLYLHVYQPWYSDYSFWQKQAETELGTILQYYSVPAVSAKNALFHLLQARALGFKEEDAHCGLHPNPLGHRYYADLAIAALQNHARDAYTVPEDAMGYPGVFAPLADVPPPMLEGNFEMHSNCLAGEQLRQAFVAELSEGWDFVDEGKPGKKPKLGFRTTQPAKSVVLQLDTRSQDKVAGQVLVAAGYLVSYEQMGRFSIACVSGCKCDGVHNVSGIHPWHTSVYRFAYFAATQHEQCRLRITSMRYGKQGGNKVKIDTLMVATGVSADWSSHMNNVQNWLR